MVLELDFQGDGLGFERDCIGLHLWELLLESRILESLCGL